MLIFIIILGIILYKVGPMVYSAFGDDGVMFLLYAAGGLIVAFVIIKDCIKMFGGGGFSVDELEFFDMMDED